MPKVKKRKISEASSPVKEPAAKRQTQTDLTPAEEPNGLTACDVDEKEVSDQATPPKTVHVASKVSLYKPPTFEELQNLKETEMLFKSNLLKLQVTELLAEVRPKKKPSMDAFLHALRSVLISIPSTEPVDLCDGVSSVPKPVKYPLKLKCSPNIKGKYHFAPPQSVKVVGSYLLQNLTKPELNVDVAVEIPQECLQAKDHLNYRYFHKRALYLCHIAAVLKKEKQLLTHLRFSYMNSDPLLPIIRLNPILNGQVSKYVVQLYPCIPDGVFKVSKLGPDRNNVRDTSAGDGQDNPATPHYNNALLRDMGNYQHHLHDMYTASQDCEAFTDAVMLFKVWLRQRELLKGYGCFNGFMVSMLIVYLLHNRKVHKLMTSYQILRITLEHLASNDWTVQGITLSTQSDVPLEKFHEAFDVVFVDSSGYYNLCGDMLSTTYHQVKREASVALKLLEKECTESFETLFMTPVPFIQAFDTLFHVYPASVLNESLNPQKEEAARCDLAVSIVPAVLRKMCVILRKGLGSRATNVAIKLQPSKEWLISKTPPDPDVGPVTLAMLLTERAYSELELGPPADSPEASTFRSFWGELSELRRFQDTSINEAVVWESSCTADRRGIIQRIIQHLLRRHFKVDSSHVTSTMSQLDQVISLPQYNKNSDIGVFSTGEETSQDVSRVFEDLNKQLRGLNQLPLAVVSVVGTSPVFRHTEVFPPVPWSGRFRSHLTVVSPREDSQSQCLYPNFDHATPPYVQALSVVCQLESSGKWPDEVKAIQQIKAAFYVKMSELLSKDHSLLCSPTFRYLDVLKEGFLFRVKIVHPWEVALRKNAATQKTKQQKQASLEMERDLIVLPTLSSCLLGIHQEFPAFSIGARLCKRWMCSQLFSSHVREEVIELIVSDLFQSPAPLSPPGSPSAVLLRFLCKMSKFEWSKVNDIVQNLLPHEEDNQMDLAAMFSSPPVVIQARIRQLSEEGYQLLSSQLDQASQSEIDYKQIFRPPLQDYHVLIHLHKKHVVQTQCSVDSTMDGHSTVMSRKMLKLPVVDFDPVKLYLKELENSFSEFALFFYDQYGGDYIAVVWRPNICLPHSFKVSQANCRKPAKRKVVVDLDSILTDFQVIGNGLVKSVEIMSDPRT
ncbi:nucleolar protein 6-like [Dysidea avara]|uniref:nucleolar protein 6-like n=1 Tax=Dysidea avara TaxID=196820 RepID=UPI003331B0B6